MVCGTQRSGHRDNDSKGLFHYLENSTTIPSAYGRNKNDDRKDIYGNSKQQSGIVGLNGEKLVGGEVDVLLDIGVIESLDDGNQQDQERRKSELQGEDDKGALDDGQDQGQAGADDVLKHDVLLRSDEGVLLQFKLVLFVTDEDVHTEADGTIEEDAKERMAVPTTMRNHEQGNTRRRRNRTRTAGPRT